VLLQTDTLQNTGSHLINLVVSASSVLVFGCWPRNVVQCLKCCMTEINWYYRITYTLHNLFSLLNQHWNKIKVLGWNVFRNTKPPLLTSKSSSDRFDLSRAMTTRIKKEIFQCPERSFYSGQFQALGFLMTEISSSCIRIFWKTLLDSSTSTT